MSSYLHVYTCNAYYSELKALRECYQKHEDDEVLVWPVEQGFDHYYAASRVGAHIRVYLVFRNDNDALLFQMMFGEEMADEQTSFEHYGDTYSYPEGEFV